MNSERLTYLQRQYALKLLTNEERLELKAAALDSTNEDSFQYVAEMLWHSEEDVSPLYLSELEPIYEYIIEKPQSQNPYKLWARITIAASIAIIIFGFIFFNFNQKKLNNQPNQVAYKSDIASGKVGATLTLANGKKIKLDDITNGELAKEAGVVITKSVNGQLVYKITDLADVSEKLNILSTAKGETYQVYLPDGSLVYLNSASNLTYSASLIRNGARRVKLQGEGYFEVAKDKKHPFIVETMQQEIEVLGTHFNINSYNDEPGVVTTLLEGSLRVYLTDNHKETISDSGSQNRDLKKDYSPSSSSTALLKPGEQSCNENGLIKVTKADIEGITDWKNGDFYLNRINFKTAMRKIARWYDVEFIYDTSVSDRLESGGWISRKNNLSSVLRSIEGTGLVHFKVEGKKIYVSK